MTQQQGTQPAQRVFPTHIVAVGGIVKNEKGEILLVKHNRAGWCWPGGQVENGETLTQALRREVMEETGIEIEVGEIFCVSSNTGSYPGYNGVKTVPTKVMFDFVCTYKGGESRPSEENSESAWFSEEEAEKLIAAPMYAERFAAYLQGGERPVYLAYVTRPDYRLDEKREI